MVSIFNNNQVWSVAVYLADDEKQILKGNIGIKSFILNARKVRHKVKHIHTYADPFMYVNDEILYLFVEENMCFGKGYISVYKTTDLQKFEYVSKVLEGESHFSYPYIFKYRSKLYMIPESEELQSLDLYEFSKFPTKVKKVKTLLKGRYFDSSVYISNGICYLFTSSIDGLEVYYAEDILSQNLSPLPNNPQESDKKYLRCGGGILLIDKKLFRVAQDCSNKYGENISLMSVRQINKDKYQEALYVDKYFKLSNKWNKLGSHHLSICNYKGKVVVAVDGMQDDYKINKILSPVFYVIHQAFCYFSSLKD